MSGLVVSNLGSSSYWKSKEMYHRLSSSCTEPPIPFSAAPLLPRTMAIEMVLYLESLDNMNRILQAAGYPLHLLTYAKTNFSMAVQANRWFKFCSIEFALIGSLLLICKQTKHNT